MEETIGFHGRNQWFPPWKLPETDILQVKPMPFKSFSIILRAD